MGEECRKYTSFRDEPRRHDLCWGVVLALGFASVRMKEFEKALRAGVFLERPLARGSLSWIGSRQ